MSKYFSLGKPNKISIVIILSTIATFVTLVFVDISHLVTTPLSPLGVNHWIPELITIFFIGYQLTRKINRVVVYAIVISVFLYPFLTYTLVYGTTGRSLGLGTASLFAAVFLVGVWSGSKKETSKRED